MSQGHTTHPRSPTCAQCGDVIGVYEPAVVIEDGAPRHTSLAAEPLDARAGSAADWHHRDCFREPA